MIWNVDPIAFSVGPVQVRWYGLFFGLGFLLCYQVLLKVFRIEKRASQELESLFMFVLFGTIIGARLGHVLFYEPEFYFSHPWLIPAVWRGGLASHGASIGILTSVWLFIRKWKSWTFLELADRVALVVPIAGACIRFGNFMNSEIIGKPTTLPWAVVFSRVDNQPRHPAQIYEAIAYVAIFGVLSRLYFKHPKTRKQHGLYLGLAMILIFTARFLIEFAKENQVSFENNLVLNMGQWLSIPFIAIGFALVRYARKRKDR